MEFNEQVVEQFTKMVANIAWYYTEDPTLHKDLMQEGFLGLMKACEKFDESRACFSTYAHLRIRRQMQYYLQYKNQLVHIPVAHKETHNCIELELDGHLNGLVYHEAEERDEIRSRL